ncbi:MAG: hypothetical protein CMM52_15980 [Rhodospirillaceae bacterium]|nr:hypothetical protein [Rhodospirillaceae bacterium]|tara:strand:- start:11921 stop:12193 length:273 start_codon:yes stop_codon:yes gene_type:complete
MTEVEQYIYGFLLFLISDPLTWIIFGLVVAIILPIWTAMIILPRAGFSPWWGLLNALPIVSLVAVWVFAFVDWPNIPNRAGNENPNGTET